MAVTREEVICAYRLLLNRDPESEAAIDGHLGAEDLRHLRHNFMSCDEYRYANGYLDRWIVAPVFNDTRLLWVNMQDKFVSIHCVMDAYEPENSALIRALLNPGDVFLDLGANVGWFTLLASTVVGPAGHIYCFEPQRPIAEHLARTIALNGLQEMVTLRQAGVWNQAGSMALAGDGGSENQGAAHLLPGGSGSARSSMVDLIALDSLALDRCDVIKMDIEGAEPKAMEGAEQLLRATRPIILSELHSRQLGVVSEMDCAGFISEMQARGYVCIGSRGEAAGQAILPDQNFDQVFTDVLFVPQEKVDRVTALLFGKDG